MNISVQVSQVVHHPLVRMLVTNYMICPVLVGVDDFYVLAHKPLGNGLDRGFRQIRDRDGIHLPAAFNDPNDRDFVAGSSWPTAFGASPLPTNICLVHFKDATQLLNIRHCRSDAMGKIPCSLISHAQSPLELKCRDSLLRLADHVGGEEPLPERQVRIVEDTSDPDRELIAAVVAIELIADFDAGDFVRRATRTSDPVRPSKLFEENAALFLASEILN